MVNIFWFRRDLRLKDSAGLYQALKSGIPVLPVFIFDRNILDDLEDKKDRRVTFIHMALLALQEQFLNMESSLEIFYGFPNEAFQYFTEKYQVKSVFSNHDYEPYSCERDNQVGNLLKNKNISFFTFKDQVIFEKEEVMKSDGKPYTVFTPYSNKWKVTLNDFYLKSYTTEKYFDNFYKQKPVPIPTLRDIGFDSFNDGIPERKLPIATIKNYDKQRDVPFGKHTTHLGVHLRFGTVSIRRVAVEATKLNQIFLNELIWRDFFQMILWHFPHVVDQSFKAKYDKIQWRNDEKEFESWCKGQTGYPIVDAGMRELNTTGFMHNRIRMVVASFLTKLLLIDWRWGESYFARKLLDYELAANNGNWQWAAGSGCDAAPYFRIFNPYTQAEKFDPESKYIKKWVPEFESDSYPEPIVDYKEARERALEVFAAAVK